MSTKNGRYRDVTQAVKTKIPFMNESGVSDVIGSMLMLTITVIMAAVIATAIFGMEPPSDVPHVSITTKENGSNQNQVDLIHMGGEPVRVPDLKFMSEGAPVNINASPSDDLWTIGTTIILDTNDTAVIIVHIPSNVSVVVGSILVLAVLVTFMSVVTSSWVPIYEGNAEADHSEQTYKTFTDILKQIEFADEFSRSTAIDLGTDEMPFLANTNSVGYLELNDSEGMMFITSNLTTDAATSDTGYGLSVVGMDTNQTYPITNFSYEFIQINFTNSSDTNLNPDFRVQTRTTTLNRWITLYATGIGGGDIDTEINWVKGGGGGMSSSIASSTWTDYYATILGIRFTSGNPKEKWYGFSNTSNTSDGIFVDNFTVSVNMLSNVSMLLVEPEGQNVSINGVEYNTTNKNETSLYNLTQHYMRQPGDGTGGDYYIDYVQYFGIDEGTQIFTYNITQDSAYLLTEDGEMKTVLDNFTVGGGTLTLKSDYNFFVDQSYIYDSGAVILKQGDGAVFKFDPQITVSNNSNRDLILTLKATVLKGNYMASGNGLETLYTKLDGPVYEVSGRTDNVTIRKHIVGSEKLWKSYFDNLNNTIHRMSDVTATVNSSDPSYIRLDINGSDILLTVQKKEITIS